MLPLRSVDLQSDFKQQATGMKCLKRPYPFHSEEAGNSSSVSLHSDVTASSCRSIKYPYQDDAATMIYRPDFHVAKQEITESRNQTTLDAREIDTTVPDLSLRAQNKTTDDVRSEMASPSDGRWAANLLLECADAISNKDVSRIQHLMWILNELASPYGDYDQRLASCFLQALYLKITGAGPRCYRHLCAAAERNYSFELMRQMLLKFQEASPWITFGHVAANGAIMEAVDGDQNVHIVDISNTLCTQWPTLLEALATRPDGAPHLRLTTIMATNTTPAVKVMNEISNRLKKFARLMGVPFELTVLHQPELEKLQLDMLDLREGEALAINCTHTLHQVSQKGDGQFSPRDFILCTLRNMNPKIVTVVEDEVDLGSSDFMNCFSEILRFYSLRFDSLEESFPRTSNERLMLEKIAARDMVSLLACDESDNVQRQEKSDQWVLRLKRLGFAPAKFSDDVVDDVRALLKRYKEGWDYVNTESGLFLTWKEQRAIFASAWTAC
ncbi:hypothetical protein O6H91_Y290400 [Diphasiastrum complanatum]|nr:hypothetical protein O6H91_Y290400 [Diphasiastrum complanatum]